MEERAVGGAEIRGWMAWLVELGLTLSCLFLPCFHVRPQAAAERKGQQLPPSIWKKLKERKELSKKKARLLALQ